jgi:hypothetical protein
MNTCRRRRPICRSVLSILSNRACTVDQALFVQEHDETPLRMTRIYVVGAHPIHLSVSSNHRLLSTRQAKHLYQDCIVIVGIAAEANTACSELQNSRKRASWSTDIEEKVMLTFVAPHLRRCRCTFVLSSRASKVLTSFRLEAQRLAKLLRIALVSLLTETGEKSSRASKLEVEPR